ncbi:sugar ABC transporter substrate-binding protein [Pendulispora albinea]|uniref:Sugar ABC transporter substrate-binding protein n=1 Tax=Pendulispora albinea TaxID=2741071 RepID=A0ABZ2LP05_9BACT
MTRKALLGTAAVLLLVAAGIAGVKVARSLEPPAAPEVEIPEAFRKRPRVVALVEFSSDPHSAQYLEGVKSEAASLGLSLEVMDAHHDRKGMADLLNNAVLQKVDGILVSHGDPELLHRGVERAVAGGIPVVAFDNDRLGAEIPKIDQNDRKIAEIALTRMLADTHGHANLVLVWVPGYAPMEKRMETYTRMMAAAPEVHEIERFGKVTANSALQTEVAMTEVLKRHPKGTIDAVWATWDEFARGASSAIRKAGRAEIKVYGIDVSNEDLEMIQDPASPWVATVGCSGAAVGRVQVRMLGYRIAGRRVPSSYSLEPVLVAREMLPGPDKPVSLETLAQFVPAFADSEDFTEPWVMALKKMSATHPKDRSRP